MSHETSTLDPASVHDDAALRGGAADGLAVVWCGDEPWRVGEVLLVPPETTRRGWIFGRGDDASDPRPRLRLVRQRPGKTEATAPLESRHVSRVQLALRRHPDGGVEVDNAGKRALLFDGRAVTSARVRAGELVEIRDQLLLLGVRRPLTLPAMRCDDARLSPAFGEADAFGYVGESPEAWRLRDEVGLLARRSEHALVLGESGAGKELVAQALHAMSARGARRLVARSAATVPAGIIDAELFGNAASYPNAGMTERAGLVGEAEGSTLYLDEIGELPLELQTHLLRLLDGGDYQRLGDARRRTADLRVVAATNRPLGQLRPDLAARFPIRVLAPGLHARREDIPLLGRHLLRIKAGPGEGEPVLSRELTQALVRHFYVTHARELGAALLRARVESPGAVVELTAGARELLAGQRATPPAAPEITREVLVAALEEHGGVRERVWRALGLPSRYVLKRLLQKHGIGDDPE